MAINNLHYRCQENSFRLKHDFDEKVVYVDKEKKEFKATKKVDEPESKGGNAQKVDDESNYEQKSKFAAQKLKTIVNHMKDFKAIIDLYER